LIKHYDDLLIASTTNYVPEIWNELTFEEHIKSTLHLIAAKKDF